MSCRFCKPSSIEAGTMSRLVGEERKEDKGGCDG